MKQPRERLVDRPFAECVGEELALWLAAHDQTAVRLDGEQPESREVADPVLNGSVHGATEPIP